MTAAAAKADIGHNSKAVGEMLAESPEILFREKDMLPALIESIEKEIADQKADASTEKGRAAMKSLAYSIATRKTKYDEAGKALNDDLRKQLNTVDVVRKSMRDQLDALRDKAKAPALAWDKKEDDRKAYVTETRSLYAEAMRLSGDVSLFEVEAMVRRVEERALHPEMLGDLLETARAECAAAISHLAGVAVKIKKFEADQEELERLRAEKAEAERKAQEAAAAEAKKKAEEERIAAAEKAAAEKAAEAERQKAKDAAEAVERARLADQAKRDAAAAEERRAAQAEIEEANRKAREAEAALERERREEAAKAAAEKARIAAEQAAEAARQRDQAHRGAIMTAAKEAIMEHGKVDEPSARLIVLAIVGGNVPAVTLRF